MIAAGAARAPTGRSQGAARAQPRRRQRRQAWPATAVCNQLARAQPGAPRLNQGLVRARPDTARHSQAQTRHIRSAAKHSQTQPGTARRTQREAIAQPGRGRCAARPQSGCSHSNPPTGASSYTTNRKRIQGPGTARHSQAQPGRSQAQPGTAGRQHGEAQLCAMNYPWRSQA